MKNIKEEIVDELFIKRNVKIMNKDRLVVFFFLRIVPVKEKNPFPIMTSLAKKKKKRKKKVLVTMDNNFTRY